MSQRREVYEGGECIDTVWELIVDVRGPDGSVWTSRPVSDDDDAIRTAAAYVARQVRR